MRFDGNFQNTFNRYLGKYLVKKQKQYSSIDQKAEELLKMLSEFIMRDGKRLRPALFYFSHISYKGDNLKSITQSIVFELFHSFCLIHDDIIDQSEKRRGKPSIHKTHGTPTAILLGDLALMLADELFFSFNNSDKVIDTYNSFKREIIIGEYLDSIGSKDIQKVMDLKTVRYSFVGPCEIGLLKAGVNPNIIKSWKEVLYDVGMAFQIKDDLVGVFGDEKKIGKSTISDLKEKKYTRLIQLFEKNANRQDNQDFFRYFGDQSLDQKKCAYLKCILIKNKIPEIIISENLEIIANIKKKLSQNDKNDIYFLINDILSKIEDMSMIKI